MTARDNRDLRRALTKATYALKAAAATIRRTMPDLTTESRQRATHALAQIETARKAARRPHDVACNPPAWFQRPER